MNTKIYRQVFGTAAKVFAARFLMMLIIGGAIIMGPTNAQTPTPTPDPELERLTREANLAKARADKAEAEKRAAEAENATLKATVQPLGTPSITAPSGNVTTDASGFVETQILGQKAAQEVSKILGWEIRGAYGTSQKRRLIIYSQNEISALALLQSVSAQLNLLKREITTENGRVGQAVKELPVSADIGTVLAAPGIITGLTKSVAELTQLFRSDTKFSNKEITISEDTVVSFLANGGDFEIYYPALFPVNVSNIDDELEIAKLLRGLSQQKNDAEGNIKKIDDKLAELAAESAELKKNLPNLTGQAKLDAEKRIAKIEPLVERLNSLKARLSYLIQAIDGIQKNIETPDATTKMAPLVQLVRSEHLLKLMSVEKATEEGADKTVKTFTLRLNIVANGTTKIKQRLFFDAKVRHSAGARITYQLFDKNGLIIKANSFQYYIDWKSSEEIRSGVAGSVL